MVEAAPSMQSQDLCEVLDAIDRIAASPEAVEAHLAELLEAGRDSRRFVRRAVAGFLGAYPRHLDRARDCLVALAGDADAGVATAAVMSLGWLRDDHPDSLDALARALQDRPEVRRASAIALGSVASAGARRILIDAVMCDASYEIDIGIQAAGPAIAADLRQAIRRAPGNARGRLVDALGEIGAFSKHDVVEFLTDSDPYVRYSASHFLSEEHIDRDIIDLLENIVKNSDDNVRYDNGVVRNISRFLVK